MPYLRVVLGVRSLATYPEGGGHWACVLQYALGLRALDIDVTVLEALQSSGNRKRDEERVKCFFRNMARHGLDRHACLLIHPKGTVASLENVESFGMTAAGFGDLARYADILLDLSCSVSRPLLSLFRHRVLVDLDPGHLQISALTRDMRIQHYDRHFSVGLNVGTNGCDVPTIGAKWEPTYPVVFLPMWTPTEILPNRSANITSVTHWNWEELSYKGKAISISKREAYLRYLDLPGRAGCGFELAVNLTGPEFTDERQMLEGAGWQITDPWVHMATPAQYAAFIGRSRAELCCAKEVFRVLDTGWFSDRSAAYLASGRPVIADETGFSRHLPTGHGLLPVNSVEDAVAAVEELNSRYEWHAAGAIELARQYFDSRNVLPRLLGI